MESFYGGPQGKDFSIKQIFTSKYQMDKDLAKGWTSPISVGDNVVVSYGLPSDANYDINKNEDLQNYGRSYNSTWWRKTYTDDGSGSAGGLSYQLIASMTGNTPRISLNDTIVLDADQDPSVIWDNTDIDRLVLTFQLPQSQNIQMGEVNAIECTEDPDAELDTETDINNPELKLSLPKSQVIETALVEFLDVGENPKVTLETTGSYTISRPALKFYLPVAQSLQQGITTVLDANQQPSFNINFDNINKPVINFSLPQVQVLGTPTTTVVGSNQQPNVTINNENINSPVLEFTLPKATSFYYGNLLGERTEGTYELTDESFAGYNLGDYYINAATGFIYQVIEKTGNTCKFQYVACIQSPLPEVEVTELDPYTSDVSGFKPTVPTVTREFTNIEETAWKLIFGMPTAPKYSVSFDFVGVEEAGGVTNSVVDTETVNIDFQIPRGSKIFAGSQVSDSTTSAVVPDAKQGDLYINTSIGALYKLSTGGIWVKQDGSIQGPPGLSLNIVKSYTIQETESLKDTLQAGVNYIEQNYTEPIESDDIFAITWVQYETLLETSYWYFKAEDGAWGRVQLTGGITNLIDNVYNDESEGAVVNKTYSIHYINSLIGGDMSSKDKTKVTYSASDIEKLLSWGRFEDLIQ